MTQQLATCPKCGQASSEADFCSECGARIGPGGATASSPGVGSGVIAASASPTAAGTAVDPDECPECRTRRQSPDGRFCEVCRYDFLEHVAGGPPVLQLDSAHAGSAAAAGSELGPPAAIESHGAETIPATPVAQLVTGAAEATPARSSVTEPLVLNGVMWDVVIAVDPSLDTDPDPQLMAPGDPERRIPLDKAENLIGRRDAKQPIVPDVRPHDPSVSRRHAKLLINADGTVAILDLDSANGTFVNGEQILGGVPRALTKDDVVTIGRWTRLRIQPRGHQP